MVTPVTQSMTATVTLISPSGNVIGTATSPSPGARPSCPACRAPRAAIIRSRSAADRANTRSRPRSTRCVDPATYGGPPNSSIATATPIDPYANKFIGNDDRTAVLGALSAAAVAAGMVSTDRYTQGLYSVDAGTGAATQIGSLSFFTSFSGMAIDPEQWHDVHLRRL